MALNKELLGKVYEEQTWTADAEQIEVSRLSADDSG